MVSRLGNACSLPLSYPSRKPALSFRIEQKRPIWLSIIGENAEKVNHVGQNIQFLDVGLQYILDKEGKRIEGYGYFCYS